MVILRRVVRQETKFHLPFCFNLLRDDLQTKMLATANLKRLITERL